MHLLKWHRHRLYTYIQVCTYITSLFSKELCMFSKTSFTYMSMSGMRTKHQEMESILASRKLFYVSVSSIVASQKLIHLAFPPSDSGSIDFWVVKVANSAWITSWYWFLSSKQKRRKCLLKVFSTSVLSYPGYLILHLADGIHVVAPHLVFLQRGNTLYFFYICIPRCKKYEMLF